MSSSELASSYAALILADDGVEMTADKLLTLIKSSNNEEAVDPIWKTLFTKALKGKDVKELLLDVKNDVDAQGTSPEVVKLINEAVQAKEEEQ